MTHISFIRPMIRGNFNMSWGFSPTLNPVISEKENADTFLATRNGSFTMLGVPVLAVDQVHIENPLYTDEISRMAVDAVIVSIPDAERVEANLPMGFTASTVEYGDTLAVAIHMDPLFIASLFDYLMAAETHSIRFDEDSGKITSTFFGLSDSYNGMRFYPDDLPAARLRYVVNFFYGEGGTTRRGFLRVIDDVASPPSGMRVGSEVRRVSPYGTNSVLSSPVLFVDSRRPNLNPIILPHNRGYSRAPDYDTYRESLRWPTYTSSKVVVQGIDENVASNHVGWVKRYMRMDNRTQSVHVKDKIKASGRWTVLDDEPVLLPAATGCRPDMYRDAMVFSVNRRTGGYRPVSRRLGDDGYRIRMGDAGHWTEDDFVLIHRSDAVWRFLFVLHFDIMPKLGHKVKMSAIMPYLVEDAECSVRPPMLSPQRGMPREVTKALADIPYCTSAISHAMSRLKYVASTNPLLADGAENARSDLCLHDAKSYMMYRPARRGFDVWGPVSDKATRVTARRKAEEDRRWYCNEFLHSLVSDMPKSDLCWEDGRRTAPVGSVLGSVVDEARAIMLDM